jgi:hypothetical protein
MKCKECPYHWADEHDRWPRCHYNSLGPWDLAPCEIEEPVYETEDYYEETEY